MPSRTRATLAQPVAQRRVPRSAATPWGKALAVLILTIWGAGLAIGFETALLLLTLVAFGAAVIGLKRPIVGLLGVSMLCTLDSISRAYLLTGGPEPAKRIQADSHRLGRRAPAIPTQSGS